MSASYLVSDVLSNIHTVCMEGKRRTPGERSAATRRALVDAARGLFTERGFAGVSTETIVRAAGVTRGALYHQFADKVELFAAVYESVEQRLGQRVDDRISAAGETDPLAMMHLGAEVWLDACAEPEVQRIALIDGPAVLGWERWREIGLRHGLGLLEAILIHAMNTGRIPSQPVPPLAHVLIGALDEAALYIARADDPGQARTEMGAVIDDLLVGLARR
jgi:AcrR family transcriptional regulator